VKRTPYGPACKKCGTENKPRCANCFLPINDKYYSAFNRFWHIKCFTCKVCDKSVDTNEFIGHDNWPCHKDCYINRFARKCAYCKMLIQEEFIKVGDHDVHKQCYDKFMADYDEISLNIKSKEQSDFES